MARPANKPKIGFSRAAGPIAKWEPKDADWRDIEKAYRRAIPETLRAAIIEATNNLPPDIQCEQNAEPIDSIVSYLEGIEHAALAFFGAFNAAGGRGVKLEAMRLLKAHMKAAGWGNSATRATREDIVAFALEMRACIDTVKNDADNRQDDPGRFDHHSAFDRYAARLIRAFGDEDVKARVAGRRDKSQGFPTTVNKSGRDAVSDFARCVAEILKKSQIKIFKEQTAYALSNHIGRVRSRVIKQK